MPKLSDLKLGEYKVVEPAPEQAGPPAPALKLSDLPAGSYNVIETPPAPDDRGLGTKLAEGTYHGIIKAGRAWDSVTGAPTRKMLSEWQKGHGFTSGLEGFAGQFGDDPEKAPTGKDIAEAAGFSTTKVATPLRGLDPKSGRWHTSPADVAGFAVDIIADPTNALPISKVAKGVSWAARKTGQVTGKAAGHAATAILGKGAKETIRNKTVQAISSVPEGVVQKYANMTADEVKNTPSVIQIKDKIDGLTAKANASVKEYTDHLKSVERDLDRRTANYVADLRTKTGDVVQADAMLARLGEEKAVLGSLSEQAEDALGRAQGVVRKTDVIALISKVHDSLNVGKGAAVGDAASAAQQKLRTYAERIGARPDDAVTFPELRAIMRQIRADTSFKQGAGEFNDALTKAQKSISENISEVLKGRGAGMANDPALKEYAGYMERMAPLSKSLEVIDGYFGDRKRAMSSMAALANPKESGRAKLIRDAVENHVRLTGDKAALDMLTEFQANREMLLKASTEDIRPVLFPDEYNNLLKDQMTLADAQENLAPLRRISQARTEILAGKVKLAEEDRRAIQILEGMFDEKILDDIDRRATIEAFSKDSTRGSKLTNLGATVGGTTGAAVAGPAGVPVGMGLGGLLGSFADKNSGPLFRRMLDAQKAPIIAIPNDAAAKALNKETLYDILKGARDRTRYDEALKGAQILHTQSDEHEKKREAIKARIKAGGNP